jgi:hypothetical protein
LFTATINLAQQLDPTINTNLQTYHLQEVH